jgi:TolB-like protein/DNA-binding SARP family transcriptional activator
MSLSLKMLGGFTLRNGSDAALCLPTRKTRALLGYLALHADQSQPREKLASLLWSDRSDKQARHSLNQSLGAIRKVGLDAGVTLLKADADSVCLTSDSVEIDVVKFRSLLDENPTEAATLYRGPLLEGVSIPESAFEEWLTAARSELHGLACTALERAATDAMRQGRTKEAGTAARRLVALDSLNEEGHRLLMRIQHEAGDRAGAIRQYQACVSVLKRELQVGPDAATKSLFETIKKDAESPKETSAMPVDGGPSRGSEGSSLGTTRTLLEKPLRPRRWLVSAVTAAVVLFVGMAMFAMLAPRNQKTETLYRHDNALPLPKIPSIAILPFENLSGDSAQEYFSDGMTDDLITDLSKISGLFVIARNSTFDYKRKPVKLKHIAEELGVRYVLEGSIRRVGEQMRINAQLIDTMTGGHLWAERYDGPLTDIFAFQDRVTKKIVTALALNLTKDEQIERANRYTDNVEAHDAFLKGWVNYRRFSAEDFAKAIPFFEKAIQLDPNYGRAYAALASLYWESVRQGHPWTSKVSPDPFDVVSYEASRHKAERYSERAMKNPSPLAYRVASAISWNYRQFDDAATQAEQAVILDPNDPDGYVALAWVLIFTGHPNDALAAVQRAVRLDPKNADAYAYVLGLARLGLMQYKDALIALQRAQERTPEYLDVNVPLAVVYRHLGRGEEARVALERYLGAQRHQTATVDQVLGWWSFKREIDVRRFGRSLIEAGLCCEDLLKQYIENLRRGGTLE